MATKTVKVKGTGKDNKVVLWERNEAHPKGQIFVANNGRVVEVAETPQVRQLIAEGRLTTETAKTTATTTNTEDNDTTTNTEDNDTTKRGPGRPKKEE